MNNTMICRALMTVAVLLGLAACTAGEPAPATGPAPASRTDPGTTAPSVDYEPLDPDADGSVTLDPGRYGLTADAGLAVPLAAVEVPEGFRGFRGFAVSAAAEPFRGLSYHMVGGVFRDACARTDPLDVGTSVDDLVAALRRQDQTTTSRPRPVTLDGHAGVYVELTASPRIRVEHCRDGQFEVWNGGSDAHWWLFEPGQVDRLWILDVDGQRVVLDARSVPGVPSGAVETTVYMAESARFVVAG
jgi:hypothetical protein